LKAPIRHGGLYLADLNPRQGTEPGKARPVLVIQTDLLNEAPHPSTWILPCTTRLTGENLLRVQLPRGIAGLPRPVLNEVKLKLRLLADL
jgi:mRNA interferase MazF